MRLTTQEEIKKHLGFSLMIKSPERVTVTGALPGLFFRIMADVNKPSGFTFFKFLDNSPDLPES